jgi:fermentation-respiration switch protein FrsA (DUF1100 family)
LNLLSRFETSRLFFPVKATEHWVAPGPVGLAADDVDLQTAAGDRIHAWWCPGSSADPRDGAVLYSHGNAGNLSHRALAIREMQRYLSVPVLIYDYPGYGHSPGSPNEKTCYASADAAYDWLTRVKGVPPEKIVLFGESLGGGPSTELATRRPFRMLVLARTFTSIPDMAQVFFPYLPARWFVFNRFDNLAKIDRCLGPVFIAHGDCDRLIPYEQGVRLFVKAREPKRFFHMAGCEHADPLAPAFYESLRDFLAETAPAAKTAASGS